MEERMQFVSRLEGGERMTDLCAEFGISRKTGYKIRAKYKERSVVGLYDDSRAPHRIPHRTSEEIQQRLVELRRQHATWGPAKLRAWLMSHEVGVRWPAASTIGVVLKKHGLVKTRRQRRWTPRAPSTLSIANEPNALWCIDFKGQFRLGNGKYCYPLTITDAYSRYLLVCEGMEAIDWRMTWSAMEAAFREYGVPKAIRSDNGSPFASRGLGGLTKLATRWLALGIVHERIEPGKPQQNGRHERMHRTLKEETTRPAAKTMLAQQERFDRFREIYNEQRPHQALGQTEPARHYERSSHKYRPAQLRYPTHDEVRRVQRSGHITIGTPTKKLFLSEALAELHVGLRELDDDRWLISFAEIDLGVFDPTTSRLLPIDGCARSVEEEKVSPMCPV